MKNKKLSSAEEIENMLTAHFSEFEGNEVDADEDEADLEVESDDDEIADDEEDILDDSEGDESDEGEDEESSDEDGEDDLEDEIDDEESSDEGDEDEDTEDEADLGEEDLEDTDAGDDEIDDEIAVIDEDEDEDFEGDDESDEDEDDLEVDSDEDDLEDIEAIIASSDDVVEALIASGAVAVIVPTATHDFQEVKAAFDQLDEDSEVDADEDEDLEVDASDDEDTDEDSEEETDAECDSDEDTDEDIEVEADEDEDLEVEADEDEDILDDADAGDDDEDEEVTDEDEADASEIDEERFHPVVDLESLTEASVEDVDLTLYVSGSDAWWNVTVGGIPAARISKEHLKPEVHAFFVQDDFARNIKQAIASEGLMPVLEGAHAEFYATAYLHSELAEQVRADAEATASDEVTEKAAGLRDTFLDCVTIASVGLAKNYWPKIGSPLKAAFFEELEEAGFTNDNAQEIIEAAFSKAGVAHFEAITAKAVELMDKSEDYREDLRDAVGAAGIIASKQNDDEDEDEEEITATTTFAHRLATGSYKAAPMKGSLGDRISSRLSH